MAAIVVFVKFVLAGHKVTTQWGHNVTVLVLPGVTVVDFHSDVVISDFLTKLPNHVLSYVTCIIINQVLVLLFILCDFADLFICNNVFLLCNKYKTCILITVLMYYTIFIVAVPYSLDLLISSYSLLCRTGMLLFTLLAVTFYPTTGVKSNSWV